MWKSTTLAVVFAVPVFTNGNCDGCTPGSGGSGGGGVDTGTVDTGDPGTDCSAYVGQGTQADLDATPRARPDLEQLAISLDGGFTADAATYGRLLADTDAMGGLQASVDGIGYRAGYPGDRLLLGADATTLSAMQGGTYADWDCPNDWYGLNDTEFHSSFVLLEFPGTFDIEGLATEYAALPGVQYAEPDYLIGDGPSFCVTRDASTWHYVFDDASGDCPAGCIDHVYRYFVSEADGTVTYMGSWSNSAPASTRPSWVTQYASCD